MSSIGGVGGGCLDSRISLFLVLVSGVLLVFSALSIGVVALAVIKGNTNGISTIESNAFEKTTTTTPAKTAVSNAPTSTRKAASTTTVRTTTTLYDGPTTTFLEYLTTTTTILEVVEDGDPCAADGSYHGFRSCRAKNAAWFDIWS